jgi:hypothetical protein
MTARRFPPPWTVEDKDTYFIVRDHNGQDLAYVYAEDKWTGARPLTRDEARRIAANTAFLGAFSSCRFNRSYATAEAATRSKGIRPANTQRRRRQQEYRDGATVLRR